MPLTSPDVGKNIGELYAANKTKSKSKKRSRAQIIAIAMSGARKFKKKK